MNAYEPAAAYHRSVRLTYQIIDLIIINTEMQAVGHYGKIRKRSFRKQNVYYFSEIRNRSVFYLTGGIPKSKYCCYIEQLSMLSHNYVKFSQISLQRARRPKRPCVQ